jgi:hypothetical protein
MLQTIIRIGELSQVVRQRWSTSKPLFITKVEIEDDRIHERPLAGQTMLDALTSRAFTDPNRGLK